MILFPRWLLKPIVCSSQSPNQLHAFRYNVFFLVHYAMDIGKNKVATKIFGVYADVVSKLPSVVLDLSRMAFERVDRAIFKL